MIDPPAIALRRRANELHAASAREMSKDVDTAALLLFYATECGLKSVYMIQNNLKHTGESRGRAVAARSFVHDILAICVALNIPSSAYKPIPIFKISRTSATTNVSNLHQAWRYGEKIDDATGVSQWLSRLMEWVKANR